MPGEVRDELSQIAELFTPPKEEPAAEVKPDGELPAVGGTPEATPTEPDYKALFEQAKAEIEQTRKLAETAEQRRRDDRGDLDRTIHHAVKNQLAPVLSQLSRAAQPPAPEGMQELLSDPSRFAEFVSNIVADVNERRFGLTPERVALNNQLMDVGLFRAQHTDADELGFLINPILSELPRDYPVDNRLYEALYKAARKMVAAAGADAAARTKPTQPDRKAGEMESTPNNTQRSNLTPAQQQALRQREAETSSSHPGDSLLGKPRPKKFRTVDELTTWIAGNTKFPSES